MPITFNAGHVTADCKGLTVNSIDLKVHKEISNKEEL